MSKTKHTPGPWPWQGPGTDAIVRLNDHNDRVRLVIEIETFSAHRGEREANARLIAAAPELLTVLEEAREELCRCADKLGCTAESSLFPALQRINAAIAKARGEA